MFLESIYNECNSSAANAFILAAACGRRKPSMPIFEYKCEDCGKRFEAIVIGSRKAECPKCHSKKLEQQLSSFAVKATSSSMPCGAPAGSCGTGGGT